MLPLRQPPVCASASTILDSYHQATRMNASFVNNRGTLCAGNSTLVRRLLAFIERPTILRHIWVRPSIAGVSNLGSFTTNHERRSFTFILGLDLPRDNIILNQAATLPLTSYASYERGYR